MNLLRAVRASLLLAAACAGAALFAPLAGAAPADRVLARQSPSPARADGDDTIALMPRAGVVQLLDGRGTPTGSADVSQGCLTPPAALGALRSGQLLFTCSVEHDFPSGPSPSDEPRVLDLATDSVRVPAGALDALYRALELPLGGGAFLDVGAFGLLFASGYYHGGMSYEAIDWRSGMAVPQPRTPSQVLDLDSSTLVTTLCAPLRRHPWDSPTGDLTDPDPLFDPFQYAPPYALSWGPRSLLTLRRCGSSVRTVLQPRLRATASLAGVQLAGGVASWIVYDLMDPRDGLPLRAYFPACGVRVERLVEVGAQDLVVPQVAHVRGALILSEQFVQGKPWRITRLSLAGVCHQTTRAWTLMVMSGRKAVRLAATSGATDSLPNEGWSATRLASSQSRARLRVGHAASLRLVPGVGAQAIRWRLGAGRWHALRARAGRWQAAVSPIGRPQLLTLQVRWRHAGFAAYALWLVPSG